MAVRHQFILQDVRETFTTNNALLKCTIRHLKLMSTISCDPKRISGDPKVRVTWVRQFMCVRVPVCVFVCVCASLAFGAVEFADRCCLKSMFQHTEAISGLGVSREQRERFPQCCSVL